MKRPLLTYLLFSVACAALAQEPASAPSQSCGVTTSPAGSVTGNSNFRLLGAEIEALNIAHRTSLTSIETQKQQPPQDAERTMLTLFSSLAASAQGYRCAAHIVEQFRPENPTQARLRTAIVNAYIAIAQAKDDLRLFTATSLRAAETKAPANTSQTVAEISHQRQQAVADLGLATVSSLSAAQTNQQPSGSPPPWSFTAAERTKLLQQLDRSFAQKDSPDDFSDFADLIRSSLDANPASAP